MDCVGCEKCRLWGKLQVLGLGTALKILFAADESHPLGHEVSNSATRHVSVQVVELAIVVSLPVCFLTPHVRSCIFNETR